MFDQEIEDIVASLSPKVLAYKTKRASQKGFSSLEDFLLHELQEKENKQVEQNHIPLINDYMKSFKKVRKEDFNFLTENQYEKLIKAYGSVSPSSLSSSDDENKYGTIRNLFFALEVTSHKGGGFNQTYKNWFLKYELLITNDEMFWFILPRHWIVSSSGFGEEVFNRYGRQSVPLLKRQELMNTYFSTGSGVFNQMKTRTLDTQLNRLNQYDDDDLIAPAYRVFKVAQGKAIRKSVVKDNPQAYIHKEGSSWSYGFSKTPCLSVAIHLNRHLIKKYGECDDEQAEATLQAHYQGDPSVQSNDATLYDGFYQCIGLFGVKKKHLQFCIDEMGEDELIINPKDAVLIDYRFLNILDWVTMNFLRYELSQKGRGYMRSLLLGADGYFDLMRIVSKKFLDENPERLKDYFSKPVRGKDTSIRNDLDKLQKQVCGNPVSWKPVKIDGQEYAQLKIGDVPLERFRNGIRQGTTIPEKYLQG
jgi:hypothetical protein